MSRTVCAAVSTALRAAASQESGLTPMTSVTRYTLSLFGSFLSRIDPDVHDRPVLKDLGDGVQSAGSRARVWQMDEGAETENAVEWALEAGYRHVDTAQLYRNERSVGAAIRRSGIPREEIFVTTKWLPTVRSAGARARAEPRAARHDLCRPVPDPLAGAVPLRTRLARHGGDRRPRARPRHRRLELQDDRLENTVTGARRKPAVNQVLFTPLHYRRELLETCERLGVVLECYSPLEQGRALDDPTVVAVARRVDRTPAQVLLRWGVQKNTVVIPKSSRRDRIVENAQIFDFELGDDDMRTLDALDRTGEPAAAASSPIRKLRPECHPTRAPSPRRSRGEVAPSRLWSLDFELL